LRFLFGVALSPAKKTFLTGRSDANGEETPFQERETPFSLWGQRIFRVPTHCAMRALASASRSMREVVCGVCSGEGRVAPLAQKRRFAWGDVRPEKRIVGVLSSQ
jgi:hypothetical protein